MTRLAAKDWESFVADSVNPVFSGLGSWGACGRKCECHDGSATGLLGDERRAVEIGGSLPRNGLWVTGSTDDAATRPIVLLRRFLSQIRAADVPTFARWATSAGTATWCVSPARPTPRHTAAATPVPALAETFR